MKQMKELEKEKDFLLQGLELVEETRSWYHQQLHRLQGHQKQLARSKGLQVRTGGRLGDPGTITQEGRAGQPTPEGASGGPNSDPSPFPQQDEGSRMQLSQLFPHVQELNRCLWQLLSLSAEVRSPFGVGELGWDGGKSYPVVGWRGQEIAQIK